MLANLRFFLHRNNSQIKSITKSRRFNIKKIFAENYSRGKKSVRSMKLCIRFFSCILFHYWNNNNEKKKKPFKDLVLKFKNIRREISLIGNKLFKKEKKKFALFITENTRNHTIFQENHILTERLWAIYKFTRNRKNGVFIIINIIYLFAKTFF